VRSLFALFLFPLVPAISAHAQDPGAMAAQQAMQQQSAQIAQQQAQQGMDQAQQAAQQQASMAALADEATGPTLSSQPKFSVKAGAYPASITVKLKGPKNSYMFYTTDGWTPTRRSTPYTGPITISSTTKLQAIAIAHGYTRSLVASADYTIGSSAVPAAAHEHAPGRVELVFTSPVKEKGLEIGDKLPVALAEDLSIDGAVVAPKGTPVLATVTKAYGSSVGGVPGGISFAARSVVVHGRTINLSGGETKEGEAKTAKLQKIWFIPGVGPAIAMGTHGENAEIAQGAVWSAAVEPQPVSTASTR
jgi:Chitobiase/beta-hexosaminidase C-terminal domain